MKPAPFLISALLFWLLLGWLYHQTPTLLYPDSERYTTFAQQSVFSAITSTEPYTILLFYKLLNINQAWITLGQFLLYGGAWLSLATVVGRMCLRLRWVGFTAVLVAGLAVDTAIWNRVISSESVALSLLVLMLAAWLLLVDTMWRYPQLARRWQFFFILLTAGITHFWIFTRLTHVAVALGVVVLSGLGLLLQKRAWRVAHAGLVLLVAGSFFWIYSLVNARQEWTGPMVNFIIEKVYPYPQKSAFFAERGLPDDATARSFQVSISGDWHPVFDEWLYTRGQRTLLSYWLHNPPARLAEPLTHWDWVTNPNTLVYTLGGDGYGIHGEWARRMAGLYYDRSGVWLALGGVLVLGLMLAQFFRDRHFDPRWLVPLATIGLAYGMIFLVWYADAYEARHYVEAALLANLGVLLLALFSVDRALSHPAPRPVVGRVLIGALLLVTLIELLLGTGWKRDRLMYPLLARALPNTNPLPYWGIRTPQYQLFQHAPTHALVLDYRGGRSESLGLFGVPSPYAGIAPADIWQSGRVLQWTSFDHQRKYPLLPLVQVQGTPHPPQTIHTLRQWEQSALPAHLGVFVGILLDAETALPPLLAHALRVPELYHPYPLPNGLTFYQRQADRDTWAAFATDDAQTLYLPTPAFAAYQQSAKPPVGTVFNPSTGLDPLQLIRETSGLATATYHQDQAWASRLFDALAVLQSAAQTRFTPTQQAHIDAWRADKQPQHLRAAGVDYLLVESDWLGWLSDAEAALLNNPAYYEPVDSWVGSLPRGYRLLAVRG